MAAESSGRQSTGFALLSVLWGVAILSLIAVAVLTATALSWKLQKNITSEATAYAIAEAGIMRACLALLDERVAQRWRADGASRHFIYAGHNVEVTIQDELGLIDLNAVGFDLLLHLFLSGGAATDAANKLANNVIDWRSAPGLHQLGGNNFSSPDRYWSRRNAPFQSIDELLLVPGMTSELYETVAPLLTVFSQKAHVDPSVAPPAVLAVLPGMDKARIADVLALRARSDGAASGALSLAGRAFSIRAAVEIGRRRVTSTTVIRLTPRGKTPCLVLSYE